MSKIVICKRCGFEVYKSNILEYDYQCFYHDEDLYECETDQIDELEYYEFISNLFCCSLVEAKNLTNKYRDYVNENIISLEVMSFKEFAEMHSYVINLDNNEILFS